MIKAVNEVKNFCRSKGIYNSRYRDRNTGNCRLYESYRIGRCGEYSRLGKSETGRPDGKESGLPTQLGNDANLMGLGETMYGAGNGATHVIFLTVGTGIGGAIVIDGKAFQRICQQRYRTGTCPLIANGEPCACGSAGCLEHYASTAALVRRFSKRIAEAGISYPNEEINGELIIRLYKQGDKIAVESLEEHCDFLGHGIAGFINIFSPQRVVIGGGLSEAGDFYIQKVSEKALRYAIPRLCRKHGNYGCFFRKQSRKYRERHHLYLLNFPLLT